MTEQEIIARAALDWNASGGEIGTPFGLVRLRVSVRYYEKTDGCGTVFLSAVANSKDVFDTEEVELSAGWIFDDLAQGASMAEIVATAVLIKGPQDFATLVRSNRDRGRRTMCGIFTMPKRQDESEVAHDA